MNMRRPIMVLLAASALMVAAAIPAAAQAGEASVRIIHLSPDAPNVDVYVNGSLTLSDVAYKQASDALTLPAGTYEIAVRAAGSAADPAAVIEATLELKAGMAYTVGAVGLLDSIQAQVWVGSAKRPDDGVAGVRAIHAAPEVGAVDVAATGGDVLLSSLTFPNASDYLMLDIGTYELDVRAAGSTDALLMTSATIEDGKLYSIIAVGGGGQPAELMAIVDAAGSDLPQVLGVQTGEGGTAGTSFPWLLLLVIVFAAGAAVTTRRAYSRR